MESCLDSPLRYIELQSTIGKKKLLKRFYVRAYERFKHCLNNCPAEGIALELGSGGGFLRSVIPEVVTSDYVAYPGVERQVDAMNMEFSDSSLRAIFLLDVFHHIPDVGKFLSEAQRCLKPGGRMLIVDPYPGWVGYPVYRFVHHEPFEPHRKQWAFPSKGPVSDANGALAWMVFERDREQFQELFPKLDITAFEVHSPFLYWLAGGLKSWSLVPGWASGACEKIDRKLSYYFPRSGSFVDIEILRKP